MYGRLEERNLEKFKPMRICRIRKQKNSYKGCGSKSVYFQGTLDTLKVYRFASAPFIYFMFHKRKSIHIFWASLYFILMVIYYLDPEHNLVTIQPKKSCVSLFVLGMSSTKLTSQYSFQQGHILKFQRDCPRI